MRDNPDRQYTKEWLQYERQQPMYDDSINEFYRDIFNIEPVVDITQAFVGHSSLKLIYPKPISFFLMSPSLHWIHHSKNPDHYDKNMGFIFPFWDSHYSWHFLFQKYQKIQVLKISLKLFEAFF